jgi:hypothetical protein
MQPVVIAVAITGSVPRKKDNPALPVTPAEQIESTHAAYEKGASLVHIHVRNDDETPSSDPARFQAVQQGIAKHCPGMIIQFSTGGRGRDQAARGSSLYLRPDMASLSTGSVNFPTIVYENSAALVTDLATKMKEGGIRPEIEIFDLSHLHGARRLVDEGLMDDRPHERHLDGGGDRPVPIRGDGLGFGAWRGRGPHRARRQHPRRQGPARVRQCRTGRDGGRNRRPAWPPSCILRRSARGARASPRAERALSRAAGGCAGSAPPWDSERIDFHE